MYSHTPFPELELAVDRGFQQELVRRLELRRLRDLNRIERPTVRDRLLLLTGRALVTCGEWLKDRSRLAGPTTQVVR